MHWLEKIYLNLHKKVYNNRLTKQKVFKNKYIISVGNLSVGGVGKTPLVALIANKLYSKYKVLIILRGYKSKSSNKCLLLDSDNNYTANIVGDESLLLSKITKAKVAISKNRELALKNCGDDVKYVLLDDAFQNPSIYQNHKIVIIDSNRFNDKNYSKLLPIGKMREPLSALTRADTVLISRCELIDKKKLKEISKEVLKYIISENLYFSETIFINTYKINLQNYQKKQKLQLSEIEKLILSKEKFGAFCGIANSEQFFINIEKQNIVLSSCISFPDHHFYSLKNIFKLSKTNIKNWITTSKDLMRLINRDKLFYDEIIKLGLHFYEWETKLIIKKNSSKQKDFFVKICSS